MESPLGVLEELLELDELLALELLELLDELLALELLELALDELLALLELAELTELELEEDPDPPEVSATSPHAERASATRAVVVRAVSLIGMCIGGIDLLQQMRGSIAFPQRKPQSVSNGRPRIREVCGSSLFPFESIHVASDASRREAASRSRKSGHAPDPSLRASRCR
jgi:hypothetical protein